MNDQREDQFKALTEQELSATQQVLKELRGPTPYPARSSLLLVLELAGCTSQALEVVGQAERWRVLATHYRVEAERWRINVESLSAENARSAAKTAKRLRNIMSTCFDGSRSGNLAFQIDDMEQWIPKFTSEWKANHQRWLALCERLGFDALDLAQHGRVTEVDAVAGDAFELRRIRAIVEDDARKRHGDRDGEPSWGVIADCVLSHVSQHRQAREELGVPEHVTLDQYVAETSRCLRDFETSLVSAGKWSTYPNRQLNQLAREIVAQAERWRIDAEHYRGEASNTTAQQVEALSAEVARLTGEVAATRAEAKRQIERLEENLAAERSTTPITKTSPLTERLRLVRALEMLGWPVGEEPEVWAAQSKAHDEHARQALGQQVAEQAAEIARLMGRTQMDVNQSPEIPINPKLGEVVRFGLNSKSLRLRAQAHRTATQLREFADRSVWPVREALHSAASVVRDLLEAIDLESSEAERKAVASVRLQDELINMIHERDKARDEVARLTAQAERWQSICDDHQSSVQEALTMLGWPGGDPIEWANRIRSGIQVQLGTTATASSGIFCSGWLTVIAFKDRRIVSGQRWTSERPDFRATDVSFHDDDPRLESDLEFWAREGTWTWRGSMHSANLGHNPKQWQGSWTAVIPTDTTSPVPTAPVGASESSDKAESDALRSDVQALVSSTTVAMYEEEVSSLTRQLLRSRAINNDLSEKIVIHLAEMGECPVMVPRDVLCSTLGAAVIGSFRVPTAAIHLCDSIVSVYGDRAAISLAELIDAAFAFGICASRHPEFRDTECPAGHAAVLEVPATATVLRHELAAKLRIAAKIASAWEEAAVREWSPLAPDYHGGDGTITNEIEGPYIEHRLVMAWRGQVQQMADSLDPRKKAGQ